MSLSAVDQIAGKIGALSSEQNTIKENISPNDPGAIDFIQARDTATVSGILNVYKRAWTGIFITGHPVYGVIGGYPIGSLLILDHPVWGLLDTYCLGTTGTEYELTLLNTYVL
jgi:hypothetical protein